MSLNATSNADRQQTLFDSLAEIINPNGRLPVGRVPVDAYPQDLYRYLNDVFDELADFAEEFEMKTDGEWKEFLGFEARRDLAEVVLPRLVAGATRFAATGHQNLLMGMLLELLVFVIREKIRAGELPVLCPTRNLPTVSVQADEMSQFLI